MQKKKEAEYTLLLQNRKRWNNDKKPINGYAQYLDGAIRKTE